MTARVSSQFSHLDKTEAAYAEFIKEKIEKAGGQIKFQHIPGHLSQLDLSVREAIGSSPLDLRKFLKKHNELFTVDPEGFVTFQKPSGAPTENKSRNSRIDNNDNSNDVQSLFPPTLKEVPGVVIKVLPMYGFIAIKNPVKTSVYFTPNNVIDKGVKLNNDDKGLFLTDIPDFLPGKKVLINATKANTKLEAKYRATRVWTPSDVKNEVLVPDGFKPKVSKDGLYDPVSIEGSGKIQKVFDNFGFITNDSTQENIFFHKAKVSNVQNVMNLAKVFAPGDSVEFIAIRSSKKDKNVKWEASKVWFKKGKTQLFKMDSSKKVSSDCDLQSQKSGKKSFHQLLENEPGKVYPHSDSIVIKFGKQDAELADADSCPFYVHGTISNDVCWEFSDADKINFDAVRIKVAPGWKALLAWVGNRPNIDLNLDDFIELSDDDSASVNKKIISDKNTKVFENSEFSKMSRRNCSSDRSKVSRPGSANSRVSNSRSKSRSRSSIDKDYDLNSSNRSKTFTPSSVASQYSNSRSKSRSRSSIDKDYDLNSSNTSKRFTPSSVASQYSNSRSNSKSRSSVDRDYDLNSEDTMSTVSGDSRTNTFTRTRRRQRRPRHNASNVIQKVSSYSSLTDDVGLESDDSYSNQDTVEFRNSNVSRSDSGTNILSTATLKASSSFESLDLKECLKPNNEYQNWGDTPYPDEDQISTAGEDISCPNNDNRKHDNNLNPVKNSSEKKSSSQIQFLKEMFRDEENDDFFDAVQDNEAIDAEVKPQKPVGESSNVSNVDPENTDSLNAFADIMNQTDSEKEPVPEKKHSPSVKFLTNLEGTILNVYCKYADINHPKLVRPVCVLWSDLYHDGVPVADKFDDMKEIIERDQTIKFNCIQVVDDEGASWQKVTIAWRGQKPNVTDMTPQKYIRENFLKVSVPESDFDLGDCGASSQAIVPATQPQVPPPPKKFLTLAEDDQDEDSSSDNGDTVPQVDVENVSSTQNDVASISSVEEEDDLADAVGQMISSFSDSEADIRALSSNIINLVRSQMAKQKALEILPSSSISEVLQYCPEGEKRPSGSPPAKLKNEMRNSETQTIITGEVIAQSLFTLQG
ncbi:hypothetical protein JTE90_008183 [Oedothorax gibbosus]|uniref:Uncharacterized protein n=1 Tax=Oedothorax gibbosus TaxID=931172 RepID=A0AAV6VH89_9ARAC|nr:hypothetical protein JTE90_008183 [Oedothorax gibbosus]